jgi:hypothetical protein
VIARRVVGYGGNFGFWGGFERFAGLGRGRVRLVRVMGLANCGSDSVNTGSRVKPVGARGHKPGG